MSLAVNPASLGLTHSILCGVKFLGCVNCVLKRIRCWKYIQVTGWYSPKRHSSTTFWTIDVQKAESCFSVGGAGLMIDPNLRRASKGLNKVNPIAGTCVARKTCSWTAAATATSVDEFINFWTVFSSRSSGWPCWRRHAYSAIITRPVKLDWVSTSSVKVGAYLSTGWQLSECYWAPSKCLAIKHSPSWKYMNTHARDSKRAGVLP